MIGSHKDARIPVQGDLGEKNGDHISERACRDLSACEKSLKSAHWLSSYDNFKKSPFLPKNHVFWQFRQNHKTDRAGLGIKNCGILRPIYLQKIIRIGLSTVEKFPKNFIFWQNGPTLGYWWRHQYWSKLEIENRNPLNSIRDMYQPNAPLLIPIG